ncbi:MAG TPA: sugar phosphate nucleotidyltransferase [Candidatus Omnitrophota bacterium]|nr:sugar phosphate nucleotidyltransferase [Candidatus Omnitrophota bacterium]
MPIHRGKAAIGTARAAVQKKKINAWAVIMAGGSGTRFWPESRKHLPKQFLNLFGKTTLLEQTFARIQKVVPASRILVFTALDKASSTAKLLGIPRSQVIGEPVGRNTAPCAAWAAAYLLKKDPSAVLGIFPADHFIKDEKTFAKVLRVAYQQAECEGMPVTLGIKPDQPHTGYGYLEMGKKKAGSVGASVFVLKRFCEKPGLALAKKYVLSKKFLWNAGIFVWRADRLLDAVERYLPAVFKTAKALTSKKLSPGRLKTVFGKATSISIDHGLMEKISGGILTIPVSMGWNDVGSWAMLRNLLPQDSARNVILGSVVAVDSSGNFIKSGGRLVATVGLRDHVVVDTGDAVLVCPMSETESIRRIVGRLQKEKMGRFL